MSVASRSLSTATRLSFELQETQGGSKSQLLAALQLRMKGGMLRIFSLPYEILNPDLFVAGISLLSTLRNSLVSKISIRWPHGFRDISIKPFQIVNAPFDIPAVCCKSSRSR